MPLIDCLISFVVAFLFMDTKNNVDLSFVIPCLNEEETIGGVIDEITPLMAVESNMKSLSPTMVVPTNPKIYRCRKAAEL